MDLSQLAAFIAEDLRCQWPQHAVEFEIEPGLTAYGDATLLRIALENLLGNAWKYTAQVAEPRVSFSRHPEEADTFTVRDNGAGFDMRFADRLFGVFQRLHSKQDFVGTGVGLASVQRIVRRHGGEISAEGKLNGGAAFQFSIPLHPPWRSSERRPRAASTHDLQSVGGGMATSPSPFDDSEWVTAFDDGVEQPGQQTNHPLGSGPQSSSLASISARSSARLISAWLIISLSAMSRKSWSASPSIASTSSRNG